MTSQSPRYDFMPFPERPAMAFPNEKRLAILLYLNIEHVPFGSTGFAHAAYPGTLEFSPDILNHGWRDYGNRVGVWRLMEIMDEFGFRATVNLNSDVCREYPQIIAAGNARGWEWCAQGHNNLSVQTHMVKDQERAFIRETLDIIEAGTGRRPRGWLGMALAESFDTPDLLAEAGLEYVLNYTHDELPVPLRVESGSLLTIPYTLEINDAVTILHKGASGQVFGQMIRDQFEVLHAEAQEKRRIMSISIHPFITGHPFRALHFKAALRMIAGHDDVWLTTGGEINDWYRASA